jgi:hypothetical protein
MGMLATRLAFHSCNLLVVQAQNQSPHQFPDRTSAMVVFNERFYLEGAQDELITVDGRQPRTCRGVFDKGSLTCFCFTPSGPGF